MKYIIMCGLTFSSEFGEPRHFSKINGETLIARTIRLLKEQGISDIAITSNDDRFANFGVSLIKYDSSGDWINAFYPTDEPVCYLFGDVLYSPEAIKTIISTGTQSVEFFASAPPFSADYCKTWAEPFAFKVQDQKYFRASIEKLKQYEREGKVRRAISWELWQVIKNTPLGRINYKNYTVINDYTCDIDYPSDIPKLQAKVDALEDTTKTNYLIHACPNRMWYVDGFLIPAMVKQGIEESQIKVYNDKDGLGNLRACMKAFESVGNDNCGTWHLQDDVLICRDFKERTEQYNSGIVCGFCSKYDGETRCYTGQASRENMWFSFPCIRIPNKYARECAEWVQKYIIGNYVYEKYWKTGVNDDYWFKQYLKEFHKNIKVLNLAPNLVNHIDYLLGGSTNDKKQRVICSAQYWEDNDLIEELKKWLG